MLLSFPTFPLSPPRKKPVEKEKHVAIKREKAGGGEQMGERVRETSMKGGVDILGSSRTGEPERSPGRLGQSGKRADVS